MKKRMRTACIALAGLSVLSMSACGSKKQEAQGKIGAAKTTAAAAEQTEESSTSAEKIEGATLTTALWDLTYAEADGWTYKEDNFNNQDDYASINMYIPKEGGEGSVVSVFISASEEGPSGFRSNLISYGFDEYEYKVNQSYELTDIGGMGLLKQEGNYWGSPCLRYLNRDESAGVTILLEITGEYTDARVDKLLSGLSFHLEDKGNVDGPWYWDGEPFSTVAHQCLVGSFTLDSQWIPFTESNVTHETFDHSIAVIGNQAFIMEDGALKRYDYDGTSLTFAEDIPLENEYKDITSDTSGNLWMGNFMKPLISWKDGAVTASYEGTKYVAMDPSGTWGISWFSSAECEKITLSGGAIKTEPMTFSEVNLISHLMVDENHIYVCGSAADESGHKVFIYDPNGNLQLTLADSDGSGLGSITFVEETDNGYLALDGNMREVVLWTKDGGYIGAAKDENLFGTSYPWFCGATKLDDGSILIVLTEDRADDSAEELLAFKLSGF